FLLEELFSSTHLPIKHSRTRLPGQCDPREKWRPLALQCPLLALECIGKRAASGCGSRKYAPLRPCGGFVRSCALDEPEPRQLLQGVVHLRTRNPRPVPYLTPLQFQVRLVAVHRPLC